MTSDLKRGDEITFNTPETGRQRIIFWGEKKGMVGFLQQMSPDDDLNKYNARLMPQEEFSKVLRIDGVVITKSFTSDDESGTIDSLTEEHQ